MCQVWFYILVAKDCGSHGSYTHILNLVLLPQMPHGLLDCCCHKTKKKRRLLTAFPENETKPELDRPSITVRTNTGDGNGDQQH